MIKQYEIPDVRDGLTSLQRRILWTMKTMGLSSKGSYRITEGVILSAEKGEKKLEKFWDFIYLDAMVPMAQRWYQPLPLIEGKGNWGSLTSKFVTYPRCNRCRLTAFSEKTLLTGLNQRTVKYLLNPNLQKIEPTVLPARIPNALVNGTSGSSHIPSHNIGEVIDAVIAMIENPDLKLERLFDFIKGPDFPTGGTIINKSELPGIYQSGAGEFRIRGIMETETRQIIVKEIPYTMINGVEEFSKYIQRRNSEEFCFTDIISVYERMSMDDLDNRDNRTTIVINLKKDADVQHNLELLYEYSDLESNFDYRALLTSNGKPCLMSLHQILSEWLGFYRETMTRQNHGISPTEEEMISDLLKIKGQFATPRKTKIIDAM